MRERRADHRGEPTLDDLRAELTATYGRDFGLHSPSRIARFADMSRQAVTYRRARVLLAGDAAHIHAPLGGQGLNTGVQDAVNLGWKLAQVVNGTSDDELLDSYHDERHRALHATMTELLGMDEPRRRIAAMIAALDVHYPLGDHDLLIGRRMPDLALHTADGATRVYSFLHDARPLLLVRKPSLVIRHARPTS